MTYVLVHYKLLQFSQHLYLIRDVVFRFFSQLSLAYSLYLFYANISLPILVFNAQGQFF